jgi:hypothetical protein
MESRNRIGGNIVSYESSYLDGTNVNVSFLNAAQLDSSFRLLYTFTCSILKTSTSFVISIRLSKTGE